MAVNNSAEESAQTRRSFGQWAKRAGLFLLFGTILVIPRIRRLRRRVWAWTGVRVAVGVCGVWLVWRYAYAKGELAALASGLLLLAFSLLISAKPPTKSVDALAQELSALVMLNGGTFRLSSDSVPIPRAQIFVHPEQIIVLGPREQRLLEIPLAMVRGLAANPTTANGSRQGATPWEVEVRWGAEAPCTTTFHYDGAFAEHLARVTESTLRSQWKKELPVIPH